MSEIRPVKVPKDIRARVLFLHGMGGDAITTWQRAATDTFWPKWIGDDSATAAVYSADYDAEPSTWLGGTMPLFDRATELLAHLEADGFGKEPLVLVGHSLGGLLIKEMLHICKDSRRPKLRAILRSVRGVVFIATPHSGSHLADYAMGLGDFFGISVTVRELATTEAHLRRLAQWYRDHSTRLRIDTHAFYEGLETDLKLKKRLVVPEASANPGVEGVSTICVEDADHFGVCKPIGKGEILYKETIQLVERVTNGANRTAASASRKRVSLTTHSIRAIEEIRRISEAPDSEILRQALVLLEKYVKGNVEIVARDPNTGVINRG